MENIEVEYKVMVNKEDFNQLINEIKKQPHQYYTQTNTYYDTADFAIKKNKMSLRIRFIKELNYFLLTLKIKIKEGHLEHEEIVLTNDVSAFDPYTIEKLKKCNIDLCKIQQVGELKTIRYEIKKENYTLCFDHNFYNNTEDYELECETSTLKKGERIISKYLGQKNIEYKESTQSKMQRALNERKNIC